MRKKERSSLHLQCSQNLSVKYISRRILLLKVTIVHGQCCFLCLASFHHPSTDYLHIILMFAIMSVSSSSDQKKYRMNIRQQFQILAIAFPTLHSQPSYLPTAAKNKNHSEVSVHASLADGNGSFAPGDHFLLHIDLNNPNHNMIKSISVDLVQHRHIGIGRNCEHIIPLVDVPSVRKFCSKNYWQTLSLNIPDDGRIIPSFYYMSSEFSGKPITVEYKLRLQVKIHGFSKDFNLNIPIVLHSMKICMELHNEEVAPPRTYDLAIATH